MTPTPDDINRLEKAAWDAHVDQVLVWERDRHTALRTALAALEREMRAWSDPEWSARAATRKWADRLAALLEETP